MLLICGDPILVPLDLIFHNLIQTGIYPDQWKHANVTPVHKKDDKQLIKNYRPISLLRICAKLFQRILYNNIYILYPTILLLLTNLDSNQVTQPISYDILPTLFTLHLIQTFHVKVRHVFLDMSKAFDKVWHEGLLFKLKQNGISGQIR